MLSATDKQTSKILLVLVIILHAALSITIKILVFAHGSPLKSKDPADPTPTTPAEGGEATPTPAAMFMF